MIRRGKGAPRTLLKALAENLRGRSLLHRSTLPSLHLFLEIFLTFTAISFNIIYLNFRSSTISLRKTPLALSISLKPIQKDLQKQAVPIDFPAALALKAKDSIFDAFSFKPPNRPLVNDEIGRVVQDNQNVIDWDHNEGEPAEGAYRHQG